MSQARNGRNSEVIFTSGPLTGSDKSQVGECSPQNPGDLSSNSGYDMVFCSNMRAHGYIMETAACAFLTELLEGLSVAHSTMPHRWWC